MKADLKAQAALAAAEFEISDEERLLSLGLVSSAAATPVETKIENEKKSYNGWSTSDGFDEPEETPEQTRARESAWLEEDLKATVACYRTYGIADEEIRKILLSAIDTSGPAHEYWFFHRGLISEGKELWATSKENAKANPRKYFVSSILNRIESSKSLVA